MCHYSLQELETGLFSGNMLKVDSETYRSCGSYELLVSNIAHQMDENDNSSYFSEIALKF